MDEFKRLLVAHMPGLMRYALALIGNYNSAENLVQDTLGRALKDHQQWDKNRSLKPWLHHILHNQFIDLQHRDKTSPVIDVNPEEILSVIAPAQPDLVTMRGLLAALMKLPVEQKEVLLMVSLEGMEYREVSEIIEVPLGTVMSRLHQSRQHLRASMDTISEKLLSDGE